jgi:hypothetical protein
MAAAGVMRSTTAARAALALLCGYCAFLGLIAAFAPHTFYADFPFLTHWVELLPPYNEHLVSDVGGLYLGFAVVLGLAAWRPRRDLVIAGCAGFLTVSVPHLAFHVFNLAGFSTGEAILELAALASLLVPPLVAIWASAPAAPGP